MTPEDGFVQFADEDESALQTTALTNEPWKILVVDDEDVVHTVTKMVLRDLVYMERPVTFLSARSAAEAREVYARHPDVAVALVDVVMETDDAGLEFVRWIREEENNRQVRIILRTGQPGRAPEHEIISRYEINDYKEKTELTNTRLVTTMTVALRGYNDIVTIERSRQGFKKIIDATGSFWEPHSVSEFAEGVITQMGSLVADRDSVLLEIDGLGAQNVDNTFSVIAGTGRYAGLVGSNLDAIDQREVKATIESAWDKHKPVINGRHFAAYLSARRGPDSVLYVALPRAAVNDDERLLEIFTHNVRLAFENLSLSLRMDFAQRETIYLLSELVEKRSESTGNHVRRVGRIVSMIAELVGEPGEMVEVWELSSTLHDVGKIAVPDHILNKPGKLTDDEFRFMQQHTVFGFDVLSRSGDELMRHAAEVARWHHEKWSGGGYPDGLVGEKIPVAARMTAIADVFDALTHRRAYKAAWPVEEAFEYVVSRGGTDFDPDLIDKFRRLRPDLVDLLRELPD